MRPWLSLAFALLLPACHASVPSSAKQETQAAPLDDVIDIGGLALHLRCVGQGEPTVVMEAGLGNDGSVWKHVQPEVARFARACVYDRAGMGRSRGPAPKPHTNRQMARELHALLTRAGLAGPWIVVGHSMGGLNVRLLEAEHPEQVAGMVLVDATVDPARTWSLIPDAKLRDFKENIPRLGEGLDFETFLSGTADARASTHPRNALSPLSQPQSQSRYVASHRLPASIRAQPQASTELGEVGAPQRPAGARGATGGGNSERGVMVLGAAANGRGSRGCWMGYLALKARRICLRPSWHAPFNDSLGAGLQCAMRTYPRRPSCSQPRYAMSWLRGPMTRHELRRARDPNGTEEPPPASTPGPIMGAGVRRDNGKLAKLREAIDAADAGADAVDGGFNRVREQLGLPTR